jgi:hypothetical protein
MTREATTAVAPTADAPTFAPPPVQETLARPGRPLETPVRHELEERLGHDFARMRIHTDEPAARSAAAVEAQAYTVGSDVVFGAGLYRPGTTAGKQLLAHELAHVAQQPEGAARSSTLAVADANGAAEREAEQASTTAGVTPVAGAAPGLVHRQPLVPAPRPWRPSDVSIVVYDPQDWVNGNGEAAATLGVTRPFPYRYEVCACDTDKGHFCPPEQFGLLLDLFVDYEHADPHPQPVRPPFVSLKLVYRPDSGQHTVVREEAPALAQYAGHGKAIDLPFPSTIPYTVDQPGSLLVIVNLADRDTEEISFVDAIRFDSVDCPIKPDQIRPRPRRVKTGGK